MAGIVNSVRVDDMSFELAMALMMLCDTNHPVKLEYKDNDDDYLDRLPDDFEIEAGETFDSITETWTLDPAKEEPFRQDKLYYKGDRAAQGKNIIEFYKSSDGRGGSSQGQNYTHYFRTVEKTETVVWGVGIIDKGKETEKVNRLVYPDFSWISLINFGGGSGLG